MVNVGPHTSSLPSHPDSSGTLSPPQVAGTTPESHRATESSGGTLSTGHRPNRAGRGAGLQATQVAATCHPDLLPTEPWTSLDFLSVTGVGGGAQAFHTSLRCCWAPPAKATWVLPMSPTCPQSKASGGSRLAEQKEHLRPV